MPGLGVFTFTVPDVTMSGVTNEELHDRQHREPVFLLAKDFLRGADIQCGLFTELGVLRPFSHQNAARNV